MGRKKTNENVEVKVTEKKCGKCRELKLAEYFYKHKETKSGLSSYCKLCAKNYTTEKYLKSGYYIDYHKENQGKICQKSREFYQNNKESVQDRMAEYYDQNRDEIYQTNRRWAAKNKSKIRAGQQVTRAVLRGELVRPLNCEIPSCGRDVRVDLHHESYLDENLLKVVGLCRKHHKRRHSGDPDTVKKVRNLFLKKFGFNVNPEDEL